MALSIAPGEFKRCSAKQARIGLANQWPRESRVIGTETAMDSNYSIFVVDDIEAGRRMTEKAGKGTVLLA